MQHRLSQCSQQYVSSALLTGFEKLIQRQCVKYRRCRNQGINVEDFQYHAVQILLRVNNQMNTDYQMITYADVVYLISIFRNIQSLRNMKSLDKTYREACLAYLQRMHENLEQRLQRVVNDEILFQKCLRDLEKVIIQYNDGE